MENTVLKVPSTLFREFHLQQHNRRLTREPERMREKIRAGLLLLLCGSLGLLLTLLHIGIQIIVEILFSPVRVFVEIRIKVLQESE